MAQRDDELKAVHAANLRILKEIDRICRKYRISYALDAGTLLGAVRHRGFIPWDDDADIVFFRDDYEAFMKVAADELDVSMELIRPDGYRDGRAFYDFTARIIYKNSSTHAPDGEMAFYEGKLNHLWVDLFILDELPKSRVGASLTRFLNKAVYGLAMGHRYKLDFGKYSWLHKLFVGVLSLMGRVLPLRVIFKMQEALALKDKNCGSGLYYYSNYQPDYIHVTLKADWCRRVVRAPFEDTFLFIPKGWDEVLTQIYGDYRTLPPMEQRVPSHSTGTIRVW